MTTATILTALPGLGSVVVAGVPDLTGSSGLTAAILNLHAPEGPAWLFLGVALAMVIGPLVATRVGLPAIIGLLAGGLVIGPQVLAIVPATDTTVAALGQLGLLYLMFSAGAELDLVLFKRYREAAAKFGLLTFGAPMTLGFTAGVLLDYSTAASLLLGSLWASHTLVTYPMVRQGGLSGNRAVATTVGATVITDTLSLVVLAGVAASTSGDESMVSVIFSLAVGLVALGFYAGYVLPLVARWWFAGPGCDGAARFVFVLAALLSAATLAEIVGIEGIVGAFFAGLGLNRLIPVGGTLMDRVEFFGSSLMVPVFLVSVGLLIKPSVVADPGTLGLAAVFCAAVVGGKAIAALWARPLLGFTGPESGLMFGLSVSQAAATLAATFVGFDVGLFGEQVVNAVLVVILVTLLLAAIVTSRAMHGVEPTVLDGDERALGRRVLLVAAREDRLVALSRVARALVQQEGGLVEPIRVCPSAADVDVDRPFLGLVESVLVRAGLETHARFRVDADAVEAVSSIAIEDGGSVVVLDWQASSRLQPALPGARDDDLLGGSPVPVILATMSDLPPRRVVLVLDERDFDDDSAADVSVAADVASRLTEGDKDRLVVAPHIANGSGWSGPFDAPIESSDVERGDWIVQHSQAGDLVVMPAHPDWAVFGPSAVRASSLPGVSVLVVADPHRWQGRTGTLDSALGALVGVPRSPVRWR